MRVLGQDFDHVISLEPRYAGEEASVPVDTYVSNKHPTATYRRRSAVDSTTQLYLHSMELEFMLSSVASAVDCDDGLGFLDQDREMKWGRSHHRQAQYLLQLVSANLAVRRDGAA